MTNALIVDITFNSSKKLKEAIALASITKQSISNLTK